MSNSRCICGSEKFDLFIEGDYSYFLVKGKSVHFKALKCTECNMLVTNPPPSLELILEDELDDITEDLLKDVEENSISTSKYRMGRLGSYLSSSTKILDIGCATGALVEVATSLGVKESIGIELSIPKADFGKSRGRDIRTMPLGECNFPSNYFDIVMAHHLLEHIPNLQDFLNEVFRILKPNGIFHVIVPRYNSVFVRSPNWIGWFPQEHFWHFTEKTLVKLLSKHKFQVIDLCCPLASEEYEPRKGIFSMPKKIVKYSIKKLNLGDLLEASFRKID